MKPSIPKGTRDFLPAQVAKRNYIFNQIRTQFERFGYAPIETPVMENLSTLTGKYGEEGDQLLFKVLNNGDYLKKADKEALNKLDSKKLTASISKRGLRYDLTVPFARFVVMHQNDLAFPFKRYQIQQVWRGDRPQKGRYQEFYQCDADVVGSESLIYEAELLKLFDTVFHNLGIKCTIKLNNRKILAGLAEWLDISDQFIGMTTAIDKLDKIGSDGVVRELLKLDITEYKAKQLLDLLENTDLDGLKSVLSNIKIGMHGVEEIETCLAFLDNNPLHNEVRVDISLARGLNYYTGCIMEVVSNDVSIGSIGGGGRYDDLTETFGLKGMSGVGISFGAARIFDVMEELSLFPKNLQHHLQLLLLPMDDAAHKFGFDLLHTLRAGGIKSDLYHKPDKLAKQMKYANKLNVPYVVIIGSDEMEAGTFGLKNMIDGSQEQCTVSQILEKLMG